MRWVRPILAVIFGMGINLGFFLGKLSPEAYLGIAGVVITWWFSSRDKDKDRKSNG